MDDQMKKINYHLPGLLRSYSREIRFLSLFVFFLLTGHVILQISALKIAPFLINTIHAKVGASIISLISHDWTVTTLNSTITSKSHAMQIAKGCDGTEGLLLIMAAMLAFPASFREKARGLAFGIMFIYSLNIMRIVGLWFILRHAPKVFDFMHVYVGQTFIILSGFLFFLWWVMHGEHNV